MSLKKLHNLHCNDQFQQPHLEQIPNRSHYNNKAKLPMHIDDELNKNISSEYQEIQRRTLTKWINVQLSRENEHITRIDTDLKDGKKLLKLLSVVAGNTNLKPEKGNMRIHHLSNVAQALNFLKEQWGIDSLPAIASESIVNGDTKSTLAIIFFIMLKYQIHPILLNKEAAGFKHPPSSPLPGLTDSRTRPTAETKLVLLNWVRSRLHDYIVSNIITNIQDFSRSWRSGLAFCLLLHRHDPDIVPTLFTNILQHSPNKITLLTLAFDVGETQLKIPRYLDPQDLLVEFPHEPSVMLYVSEMFNMITRSDNNDSKRKKRLQDISLIKSIDTEDSLSQYTLCDLQDSVSPSDSSTSADNEEWEQSKAEQNFGPFYGLVPKDDLGEPVHPLNGTLDMAASFEISLSHVSETQSSTEDFRAIQNWCYLFKRGVMFAQITTAIREELQVIQQLMTNSGNSSVNSTLLQNFEQRIYVVNTTLGGVRDEYYRDLLSNSNEDYYIRFVNCMDDLEEQYDNVCHWVNQVRAWYGEAQKIRDWIERHIKIIESRNDIDAFDPVSREISIDESKAYQLHQEHETLKQEIDGFDSVQLKAHMTMITNTTEDLTPAETSFMEITLTTLNLLGRLTQLLNNRSRYVQLLVLRLKWEASFGNAIQWIASTDKKMDDFLRGTARWSEKDELTNVEDIIAELVSLERQISDFDNGPYSDVLDVYQELENTFKEKLPDYLENRQVGFEKAFEDLMKRSTFSRQVVEQLLSMINTIGKFKELRQEGEKLRHHLMQETLIEGDEELYSEKVQLFKEEAAILITNASTYIPSPVVPKMSTAMGAHDAHDTEITNENIKSALSTYSMAVALIADVLDQLLMSRYQTTSLQTRTTTALSTMTRLTTWMDERVNILQKTNYKALLHDTALADIHSTSSASEELHQLDRERDTIMQKLYQMENDELTKCYYNVQELEKDIDSSNAVSIDRYALVISVENLEKSHMELKEVIYHQGLQLDSLKKRKEWENHLSKASIHVHTLARKIRNFCEKKALYDPHKENVDKPSYQGDREIQQSLHSIQERIVELEERFLMPLNDAFSNLKESYTYLADHESDARNLVPESIPIKHNELMSNYGDLKQFSLYTADVMTQRSTITEFLLRVQDACQEGEKIKEAFTKRTRLIMMEDTSTSLTERKQKFKQEIKDIWNECGENMIYPAYNKDQEVNVRIKQLLDTKMKILYNLDAALDKCIDSYNNANEMKMLVMQYEQEASELGKWINTQIELLKLQYIDVSTECFSPESCDIAHLHQEHNHMVSVTDEFENRKVKDLHDNIAQFLDDSSDRNMAVDISPAASKFAQMMDQLSQLKQGLADQSIALDAASKRMEWEKHLHSGMKALESMNEQVHQFTLKKNQVISQDELTYEQVQVLERDLSHLIHEKDFLETTVLPDIQTSYDTFIECFPKLSKPIATPDHLELRMESLNGLSTRLQENIDHRSEELNLMRQRLDWEELAKQVLLDISEREKIMEYFEKNARWRIDLLPTCDEEPLRGELSTMVANFKNYENSVIKPLKQQCESLITEMTVHNNNTSSLAKKMGYVQKSQDDANDTLQFYVKLLDQRFLVFALSRNTLRLEQSADMIQLEIKSINPNEDSAQLVELFDNHSRKLELFKSEVQDVQNNLITKIPFPTRTPATPRDNAENLTVREAINGYRLQLDQLSSSLQQLLESKERTSRKTLSLHHYKKQMKITENWIDLRQQEVCTPQIVEDIEKLETLINEYSAIEQTMSSDDSVFTALVSVYNNCVTAFNDDTVVEEHSLVDEFHSFVQPTQNRLCQSWADLLGKVVMAKRDGRVQFIALRAQLWLNSLKKLWESVNNIDVQAVTDDQINIFTTEANQLENEEYTNLQSDFMDLSKEQQMNDARQTLEEGLNVAKRTSNAISSLKRKLHLFKLTEKFSAGLADWERKIQGQSLTLANLYKDYEIISFEVSSAHYQERHKELEARFESITCGTTSLKAAVADITDQHQSIFEEGGAVNIEVYEKIKSDWNNLLGQQSQLSLLVSRSCKWLHVFESLETVRSGIKAIEAKINEHKLNSIDGALIRMKSLICNELDISLVEDQTNFKAFKKECSHLSSQLNQLEEFIQKQQLINSVKEKISMLQTTIYIQFDTAKRYCERFDLSLKNQQEAQKTISDNNAIISSCQKEVSSLRLDQCLKLTREFSWLESEIDRVLDPVTQDVKKLILYTYTEQQHVDLGVKFHRYVSCQSQLLDTLEKFVDKLETNNPEVPDMDCQFESLEEAAQQLNVLYDDILPFDQYCCFDYALKEMKERQQSVTESLDMARGLLKKAKTETHSTSTRQELENLLGFMQDMTDRVNSSGTSGETEFKELCSEFYVLLETKRSTLDTTNSDNKVLHDKIQQSISNLESAIDRKKKSLTQHDFLNDFETNITSLISIIDQSSPSHSKIINNKFVRSDLQCLLKNLIRSFKQHKTIINNIIDQVLKHRISGADVKEMQRRWAKVQSAASAREKELKTCINKLDHEFFTKLAIAKTAKQQHSPIPSVKAKRQLYVPNPENELDVKLGQIINRYKVAVKDVPGQIGKYWFGDINPRLVYCRILPSKLVMVRVGGGWVELSKFLREHGFIDNNGSRPNSVNETRDHASFQEVFLQNKRPMSPANRITIRGGSSSSSSLLLRRSTSKVTLNSPLPGYVDGDKFVSMDENGHPYFVKMKKASDDAKTPIISKKKH